MINALWERRCPRDVTCLCREKVHILGWASKNHITCTSDLQSNWLFEIVFEGCLSAGQSWWGFYRHWGCCDERCRCKHTKLKSCICVRCSSVINTVSELDMDSAITIIWTASSKFVSSSIPSWQILTAHAQPFRGARDLAFCLKVSLDSMLVWASSEDSGETARMRRLAWKFVMLGMLDKYTNSLDGAPVIMKGTTAITKALA